MERVRTAAGGDEQTSRLLLLGRVSDGAWRWMREHVVLGLPGMYINSVVD